jgi:hypothetical protein
MKDTKAPSGQESSTSARKNIPQSALEHDPARGGSSGDGGSRLRSMMSNSVSTVSPR